MDLMKTVMVYMAMTFATSVYGAPAYQETTPPPAPEAQVEVVQLPDETSTEAPIAPTETPKEAATEVPTETPTEIPTETETPSEAPTEAPTNPPTASPAPPTATPEPPKPTITPSASYKLIKKGSKGDEVKLLQERLIELGYLKGEADGVFGTKTKGAVERFQRKNGLSRDGVAGGQTQTILFESDTVIAAAADATTEPTDAPPTDAPVIPADPTPAAPTDIVNNAAPEQAIPTPGNEKMEVQLFAGDAFTGFIYLNGKDIALETTPLVQASEGRLMVDVKTLMQTIGTLKLDQEDEQGITLSGILGDHSILICYTLNEQVLDMVELEVDDIFIDLTEEMIYYAEGTLYLSSECLANAFGSEALWIADEMKLTLTI